MEKGQGVAHRATASLQGFEAGAQQLLIGHRGLVRRGLSLVCCAGARLGQSPAIWGLGVMRRLHDLPRSPMALARLVGPGAIGPGATPGGVGLPTDSLR